MRLILSPDCPLFQERHRHDLLQVLSLVTHRRWHSLVFPEPRSLQKAIPPEIWQIYGEALQQRYKLVTTDPGATFGPTVCAACDPESLVHYLELDTKVIVENAGTDGGFLHLLVDRFRPALARRLRHPGSIDVRQAGGIGEVPKEAERQVRARASLVPDNAPLRVVAIVDSDAPEPAAMSDNAKAVLKHAADHGYAAHVLTKRTIENYVPDDALHEYGVRRADRRKAVDLLLELGRTPRDHFPMKSGLNAGDVATGLYPESVELGLGLGDFIDDLLTNFGHFATKDSLIDRDGQNELEAILVLIEANV